jgi:hypothetical protein
MPRRYTKVELVRWLEGLPDYPAVFMPVPEGGFEVIFPNFVDLRAYGVKLATAMRAALERRDPPRASRPERLVPDPDEPPGTRLLMVSPDKKVLRKRLGLERREPGAARKLLGLMGR